MDEKWKTSASEPPDCDKMNSAMLAQFPFALALKSITQVFIKIPPQVTP